MIIQNFVLGLLHNNTYLAIDEESKKCFIVDPSTPSEKVAEYIETNGLTLEAVLITHGHFDHIGGAAYFKNKFGAKIYMSKEDEDFIDNPLKIGRKYERFDIDIYVKDGDVLDLCGQKIRVIATPGHSAGGVCYVLDDSVFCGDTVFYESYGRYDLRGGDFKTLCNSVKKILSMEGDYRLFCGHGEITTTAHERQWNPVYADCQGLE